jgi:hypothetical protein
MTAQPDHPPELVRVLRLVQIGLDESKLYVGDFHAHSDVHTGHKWSLAAVAEDRIVGVAVIGRPTAPVLQNGDPWALEVLRVCVERGEDEKGYRNACSFLYGASWRSIKAMGYLRAVTYTKDGENGASLRAAGWVSMDYRRPRTSGWDSRDGRKSGGARVGGERWEVRAAAWRADLPPRPRVLLPGQMELAA